MDLFVALIVIGIGCAVVGTGFFLFNKLRPKFPARVNCWFCNKNTKVPFERRNDWDCPFCEQYNGFSVDGGYNKPILAQHDLSLNHSVAAHNKQVYLKSTANKFCRNCTVNQQLKIQQLASFVPIEEDNFEEEIEQYRIHLERAYALCQSCESVLKDTLTRQTAWLLGLQAKEKSKSYIQGKFVYDKLLAVAHSNVQLARAVSTSVCAVMLASSAANGDCRQITSSLTTLSSLYLPVYVSEWFLEWLIMCHRSMILAAAGMIFQVVAVLGTGASWCAHDLCAVAGWVLVQLQYWATLHLPIKDYILAKDIGIFHGVTLLATLTCSLLPFVLPRVSKGTLKKIQSDSFKRTHTSVHATPSDHAKDDLDHLTGRKYQSMNSDSSPLADKHSPAAGLQKKLCDAATFHYTDSTRACKRRMHDELYASGNSISSPYNRRQSTKCYSVDSRFEQDLYHGLGSLSLGSAQHSHNRRWVFEPRVYGGKEFPGLFTTMDNRPRPLLSPPRFGVHKNVTRSPWSAGGYWQTPASFAAGHDGSPLSRSSSRSSGFGSMSSRAAAAFDAATVTAAASPPGSRAGSVCAGDDRFSVHSLPAYPPNIPPTYFSFYGAPYLLPHVGGYAVPHPYCFSASPASPSLQSSPGLSDSDSSCASQKDTKCSGVHKGFLDVLRGNVWLSLVIGSSLLLNAVATLFFIFTSHSSLTGVP